VPEDDAAVSHLDASTGTGITEIPVRVPESSSAPPGQPQPGPVPWVQAIGAATAFVAVGLGVVYGLGAIAIALRLWYVSDPVTPVLGQLPSNFLLVDAFSELILPATAVGAAAYFLFKFLLKASWRQALTANEGRPWRRILIVLFAALLALAPIGFLWWYYGLGDIRSPWEIYLLCAGLSILSIYLALRLLALVREHEQQVESERESRRLRPHSLALTRAARAGLRVGIAALALAPWVTCTFAAAFPLPPVYLCGPSFSHVDSLGRHFADGLLIGATDQWAYIAETRLNPAGTAYVGNYIAVIPLSEVQLQAIGRIGECNDIVAPPRPAG
jgi:hypothetical protein